MSAPILATKLYIPPPRPKVICRPHLTARLGEGLASGCKLILISASAGSGKTTLVSEWVAGCGGKVAWLSLDAGDSDPPRFLAYLVATLQTVCPGIGFGVSAALDSPRPPAVGALLTALINEIVTVPENFVLVLDDYHLVDAGTADASPTVDDLLALLLERQPPQMRLVIATREDPRLPLARLRARGQMAELRAADLRFTPTEAAEFLNRVMGLNLAAEEIAALEARTEGWIAGLQLAAISMQGSADAAGFIKSFTGSHRFVLDYLVEEVLHQQRQSVQTFLLRTSVLDRLCGSLCDAVLLDPSVSAQAILEYLERANLFIVPLDNERRWYRYHHLFAELLRQRLGQRLTPEAIAGQHVRASEWHEAHGSEIEAFLHATAARDIERAERLIARGRLPLHSLATVTAVLNWLDSLPQAVLDARPWLWVRSAMSVLMTGQLAGIEEKLQAAEKAMRHADLHDATRDLTGQIAAIRATLAILRYEPELASAQARRALAHLRPDNLSFRSRAFHAQGVADQLQGERIAARAAYTEAIANGRAAGGVYHTVLASTALGRIQESDNQLYEAAETYRRSLELLSDQGPPNADQEYIGLARVSYEWNDLDAAERYGQQSLQLARQYDPTLDRYVICEVLLARIKLARGDADGAAAMLAEAEQAARRNNFAQRLPEIAAAQVVTLLRQGDVPTAARLAQAHDLPVSQTRVLLAGGDVSAALALLAGRRQYAEARGWQDERLQAIILQSVAHHARGDKEIAAQVLREALALAEPGGFVRAFLDEGEPMRLLLADFRLRSAGQARGQDQGLLAYVDKLLAAFDPRAAASPASVRPLTVALLEPLSQRELEILKLIAQGLSNREIGARLFLALDTVKGHNRRIFDKLQVQRRTEAIARARELGLL